MKLASIILTTLNSERFVARAVENCLNQSYPNIELLIVDGGSQDRTLEIVARYDDTRIRVIHQPANSGKLPGAINLGMANAHGDFITWAQDDSWYELNAIQIMAEYLEKQPEVAVVYTDYWDVDENGHRLRYQQVHPPEDMLVDDVIRQCFLLRREVYEAIGPQDTHYFPVHEVPWRNRVMKQFKAQPLHIPLHYYTVHSHSLTGRIGVWSLERSTANALYKEGYLDAHEYRLRLAKIDVDQAYAVYIQQGQYAEFWRYALAGVAKNWRWLINLGLWKLALISLTPFRSNYRDRLYARWCLEEQESQSKLIETSTSQVTS
jgi:glycosyltransferase involved in cell wall biosynthesis